MVSPKALPMVIIDLQYLKESQPKDFVFRFTDANQDGHFTKIAWDNGIPLTEIDFALGPVKVIQKVFGTDFSQAGRS